MRLIAFITQPDAVAAFLTYLGDRGRMMQPDSIGPLPRPAGLALPVERQSPPTSRFGGRRRRTASRREIHRPVRRACDRGIEPPVLHEDPYIFADAGCPFDLGFLAR
jgi:hypothetical protein